MCTYHELHIRKKINKRAVIFFKKHCITSYRSKTLFRTTLGIANIVLH